MLKRKCDDIRRNFEERRNDFWKYVDVFGERIINILINSCIIWELVKGSFNGIRCDRGLIDGVVERGIDIRKLVRINCFIWIRVNLIDYLICWNWEKII